MRQFTNLRLDASRPNRSVFQSETRPQGELAFPWHQVRRAQVANHYHQWHDTTDHLALTTITNGTILQII